MAQNAGIEMTWNSFPDPPDGYGILDPRSDAVVAPGDLVYWTWGQFLEPPKSFYGRSVAGFIAVVRKKQKGDDAPKSQ